MYATVSWSVTVDLEQLEKNSNMKIDREALERDEEYKETIQNLICNEANRILENNTIKSMITSSDVDELVED
jgi:hypothetical protein